MRSHRGMDTEETATVKCSCPEKEHTLKVYNNTIEWVKLEYHFKLLQLEKLSETSAAMNKLADSILRAAAYR